MREEDARNLRHALHADCRWLNEVQEVDEYVAMFLERGALHYNTCKKSSANCDICTNFHKYLPESNAVENKLGSIWADSKSIRYKTEVTDVDSE